jgi:hypothetical protein
MKKLILYSCTILLALIFISIIGCNNKPKKNPNIIEKKYDGKTIVQGKWEAFPVGDIDNDKISDTAFVYTPAYYGKINPELPKNDNIEFEDCVNSKCYNKIKFSNNFPSILVENSLWGSIESIEDLDGDSIKELIFQTNWYIGTHVEIYVYSFDRKKRKWFVLAKNNLYGQDSYKDRITKINKEKFKFKIEYMDTIEHDLMNKEIVVKIKK